MNSTAYLPSTAPKRSRLFPDTRWSLVDSLSRCDSNNAAPERAFDDLCKMYWYPIYAYIRTDMRKSQQDAEDLTQGYFGMVVEKGMFHQAKRSKGKLRTYICLSVKRFVIDANRGEHAFKRGEGVAKVPLDVDDAEERLALEDYQSLTPDEAFDKRCLMSVFEEIFGEIEAKYHKRNELEIYRAITPYIAWGWQREPHSSVAEQLGITPGALRMRISRVRETLEQSLRNYIRRTVSSEQDVEEEIGYYRRLASKS